MCFSSIEDHTHPQPPLFETEAQDVNKLPFLELHKVVSTEFALTMMGALVKFCFDIFKINFHVIYCSMSLSACCGVFLLLRFYHLTI